MSHPRTWILLTESSEELTWPSLHQRLPAACWILLTESGDEYLEWVNTNTALATCWILLTESGGRTSYLDWRT